MDMQQLPDVRVTAHKVNENGFLLEFLSEDATASIPCVFTGYHLALYLGALQTPENSTLTSTKTSALSDAKEETESQRDDRKYRVIFCLSLFSFHGPVGLGPKMASHDRFTTSKSLTS
jgi:hypothetical protein